MEIIETEVREIEHNEGQIKRLIFDDGRAMAFESMYAALPFRQHSDIPAGLGCKITDLGYIEVDSFQRTSVEGVYACGDNSAMMRSVANAVYTGNLTGAIVNSELTGELFYRLGA